jgi:hypothetical protein
MKVKNVTANSSSEKSLSIPITVYANDKITNVEAWFDYDDEDFKKINNGSGFYLNDTLPIKLILKDKY